MVVQLEKILSEFIPGAAEGKHPGDWGGLVVLNPSLVPEQLFKLLPEGRRLPISFLAAGIEFVIAMPGINV